MEASAVPRLAPSGAFSFRSSQLLRLAPDSHLVALIREGRGGAFEAAYDRHHRGILTFCRHMLGDPQEAEDAVQHTFLAAYNDLVHSHKQIHLRAWLFTIARNRCYSILRARREQPAADLDEAVTEGLATQVQRRQDLRDLVVDMRRLPEDQRAALVLAELESLSHEQIAEALGVPREKVKALVFQARESLLASRTARETDCSEIREQLATQRGGALRRANLRRHLRECPGCRDFKNQIERQRHQLALLLPVAPTLALKEGVLAAGAGGGATAGIAGGGLVLSSAIKSGLAKVIIGAVLAGVGTAGTIVASHGLKLPFGATASPPDAGPGPGAIGTTTITAAPPSPHPAPSLAGDALTSTPRPAAGGDTLHGGQGASASFGRPTGGASFVPPGDAALFAVIRSTTAVLNHVSGGKGARPTGAASLAPTASSSGSTAAPGQLGTTAPSDVLSQGTGTTVGAGRTSAPHRGGQDGGYGTLPSSHGAPGGTTRGEGGGNGNDSSGNGTNNSAGTPASTGGAASGATSSGGSDGSGSAATGSSGQSPSTGTGSSGSSSSGDGSGGSGGSSSTASSGGASITPHGSADSPGAPATPTGTSDSGAGSSTDATSAPPASPAAAVTANSAAGSDPAPTAAAAQ